VLQVEYSDAIVRAGGVPVLLPPASDPAEEAAEAVVARIDGLVVSGGADVDPERYGEQPHPRTAAWRPDRDAWEIALLNAAAAANLPTLGVCRGMQVMAVAAGGTLEQHTPDVVGSEAHSPGGDVFGEVLVNVAGSSTLQSVLGAEVTVHCHHHQSVRSHPGYEAVATAADGTLEAMEAAGSRFCLAVQWHPEMGRDQRLFDALVRAATLRR
jgi:putative glutamine amidotransferase